MSLRQLLDVPAPAKLNLFLHITGRRPDGYHLLQSVFMLIDWCDTLHFERRAGGAISREDIGNSGQPLPDNDLVVRAARALQQATGCEWGAHVALDKSIPQEAGMGGGSSDAASCLLALNRLWGLELPLEQLLRIGLTLGADVPFFLGGDNAWVEGVGEQLTPVELPDARFLVLKPPTGASTPKIFSSPDLKRDTSCSTMRDFFASGCVYEYGRNDLQPVAASFCPDIKVGLDWLESRNFHARMTGSGSAIFALASQAVDSSTLPNGWIARSCKNLFEHPLKQWRK
ncbi:MAG: hypothetical protein RJA36_1740 [Pseudomonadota bacterium]|jgi:4-diphosphocytidyl-2-C-methyl-D-erythritol kinase